jgi:Fe-S cluster assembly iron-binding protein IscA
LGLALDESKDNDEVFNDDGLTFVIEKEFFEKIKPVKVDFIESPMGAGFNIESSMPKPESSCGSCSC